MARPSRDKLAPSAQRVASAFEEARQSVWEQEGRRLTQAEFARNTLNTSPRYLRLVLEGKRSAAKLTGKADRAKLLQVEVESPTGDVRSFTMRVPESRSQLDFYKSNAGEVAQNAMSVWQQKHSGDFAQGGRITKVHSAKRSRVYGTQIYRITH